jgi:hypothetical protein
MVRKFTAVALLAVLGASGLWITLAAAQTEAGKLAASKYVDPKGFFSIIPPDGWKVTEYPQDPRGKVAFIAPEKNTELRVLINAVDFSAIDQLVVFCKDVEKRLGFSTNIKKIDFQGRPAVQRTFSLKGIDIIAIDFLVGKADHNLQFNAPKDRFQALLPLAQKSMETYEPVLKEMSPADIKKHQVAKKLRLAQLMVEQKNYDQARQYLKEGLEIDAKNADLLKLQGELKDKK